MHWFFNSPTAEVPDFEAWYAGKSWNRNPQTYWLLRRFLRLSRRRLRRMSAADRLRFAQEALARFWLVGKQEALEVDAAPLMRALGVSTGLPQSNVSGVAHQERLVLTPELRSRLCEDNAVDVALYETCAHAKAPAQSY